MADINNPKEYLEELLGCVDNRDNAQKELEKHQGELLDCNSQLTVLKNTIEKEKNETVRRRKNDLEAGYNKQLSLAQTEINAAQDKRRKALNEGIARRTAEATKASVESAANDEQAFKAYTSAQKLPVPLRSKAYYALFCPGVGGYTALFVIFLLVLVISIWGIISFFVQGGIPLYIFWCLLALDILALAAYILIWMNTRVKYRDQIIHAKEILKSVKNNKKAARNIEKSIRRIGDDSTYGLEEFDKVITEKNAIKANIEAQKASALSQFENETREKLHADIDANYKSQADQINVRLSEAEDAVNAAKAVISEQEARLTRDFVSYVGSENLTHDNVSRMLGFINDGSATTVASAVAKLKEASQ